MQILGVALVLEIKEKKVKTLKEWIEREIKTLKEWIERDGEKWELKNTMNTESWGW